MVNDIDAFNRKATQLFSQEARLQGLTVDDREEVPVGSSDFRTLILKLKNNNPQAVFIELQDTSSIGSFNKQAHELGMQAQIISTTNMENPGNLQKFPNMFDGVVYSFPHVTETAGYQTFMTKYKAKYGSDPFGPSIVNAYNATLILIAALKNGAVTGEQIKEQLKTAQTPGVGVETLSFDKNGQIGGVSFDIKTIRNNQFVKLNQ